MHDEWDTLIDALLAGGLPALEVPTSSLTTQRWDGNRRQKWQLARPEKRFRGTGLTVERVDRATAEAFVIGRHYSGSHVACRYSYGLYRRQNLVGVASYCVTTEAALTFAFPELRPGAEALELGRFVVADPEPGNVETWFIARCHELLYAAGVRAVLSFADPVPRLDGAGQLIFPGHVGYIYQGANFLLAGRSTRRTHWRLRDGTILNGITMQKIRKQDCGHEAAEKLLVSFGARPMRAGQKPADWLREVRDDPTVGIVLVRHRGCHRYLAPLGRNQRERDQIVINRKLRPDWAALDEQVRRLPRGPYPKTPDVLTTSGQIEEATHAAHGR